MSGKNEVSRIRKMPPGVDPELLARDAAKLMPDPARRLFLRGGASLGALAFLAGCDIVDSASAERVLMQVSYFNDRVQAWLFNPNKLAPTFSDSAVTRPFPFNAYYPEEDAPEVEEEDYKLQVGGLVQETKPWTLDELRAPAAGDTDHPACMCRGLERDRQMDGNTAARLSP